MEYLKCDNESQSKVHEQIKKYTNESVQVGKLLDFIQLNPTILEKDEYITTRQEIPEMPPGMMGLMIMDTKYSLNIKRSSLVILAFLLDLSLTKGMVNTALGISGFTSQALHKISDNERCVIIDILISNKNVASDFNYNTKECVQNDIECPFRDDGICLRTEEDIDILLKELISKEVIEISNGIYKQKF